MYSHHIRQMAVHLVNDGLVELTLFDDAVESMQKEWLDKMAVSWGAEDIQSVARNKGFSLTSEQIGEVLDHLLHKHDASIGINWDVIDATLDILFDDDPRPLLGSENLPDE